MNQFIPIIYLLLIFIILTILAIFITVEIFGFYTKQFVSSKLNKNYRNNIYKLKQYEKISDLYIKQKLWFLALNNLENIVLLNKIEYHQFTIFKQMIFIYKKIGLTNLRSKYLYLIDKY